MRHTDDSPKPKGSTNNPKPTSAEQIQAIIRVMYDVHAMD